MNLHTTYEETELIALLKQRDHYAFKFLYEKYSPALYSVILQIVRKKEIADKVVENTFMLIWQKIDGYNPVTEKLFTWILKTARNTALAETTTSRLYQQQPGRNHREGNKIASGDDHTEMDECGLKKVVNKLKHENMMLIDLCYFKNLTDDQIAETLNIPTQTVKVKIKTALTELRNMLD